MLETESKKRPIPALIAVKQEIDLSVESSSMPLPIETIPRPNFAQVSGESIGLPTFLANPNHAAPVESNPPGMLIPSPQLNHKLFCLCQQPHGDKLMIRCCTCEQWFHAECVGVTMHAGIGMQLKSIPWDCQLCLNAPMKKGN